MQKKIARIAADAYAMEAMTTITASLIDRGLEDYMLETAMLKVFTTERLWECINDAFQIHGGSAYFIDLPLERMLRDARINQIGEGSNEVLTSFIALVGMRGPGMEFKEIYDTMMKPTREQGFGKAWTAGKNRLGAAVRVPDVPVRSAELRAFAESTWPFDLAFQYRRKSLTDYLSRADSGYAAGPGADRECGDGPFCFNLRAQSSGCRA